MGKKEEIILSAQDEEDILEILEKDELISIDDVKKNLDL